MLFDAGALISYEIIFSFRLTFLCSWQIKLLKHQPIINDALASSILYFVTDIWRFPYPLVLHSLFEDPTSHAFSVY
jgi:hypothetical protein